MDNLVCIMLPGILALLTFVKARTCRRTRRVHLAKSLLVISILSGAMAVIFIATAIAG